MRAAEIGLRAFASHLRVKIHHPLEFADWGTVINGIKVKLSRLPKPRGKKRAEALEFYHRTTDACVMLKDVWRNNVMHTRGRHSKEEALAVFDRVRSLLTALAARGIISR